MQFFLGLYLFLLSRCHPSAADTIGLQCEWMLQCYLRVHILSERRRRKKKEQRGEKMPPGLRRPSRHQSARSPSSPRYLNSLPTCLPCNESESLYVPAVFALLWCEVPNWIPHLPTPVPPLLLTGSQPADSFCELGESCCRQERTMWEQPLSNCWNMGLGLQMGMRGGGNDVHALNQLASRCIRQATNTAPTVWTALLPVLEKVCSWSSKSARKPQFTRTVWTFLAQMCRSSFQMTHLLSDFHVFKPGWNILITTFSIMFISWSLVVPV